MPFPLAHPAAVLPLRRYCPRWLSFPALVLGSLSPDAGYLFGGEGGDDFSHTLLGSIGFCLPIGIVLVVLFWLLRLPVVRMLPRPYHPALLPACRRPISSLWGVLISLLIGIWTHLIWDSFTHKEGWCVQHLSVLQAQLGFMDGRTARVCHVLWYICSFAGMVWLYLAFAKWKRACVNGSTGVPGYLVIRDAVLAAILLLPIELAHHLVRDYKVAWYLLATLCALPVVWIVLKVGKAPQDATGQPAAEAQGAKCATSYPS